MYNILIVDDEITVVNGLAYDIAWSELEVTGIYKAYNANQAIEYMKKSRIDIVLTDIRMPEMDGLELANLIRTSWPYAKVILISGHDEFSFAQKAIDLGVLSYITKPAYHEKVQEAVMRAIVEIKKELVKTNALDITKRRLEEELPLLQERYLNAWAVRGSLELKTAIEKLKSCNMAIDVENKLFLILVKVDRRDHKTDVVQEGIYRVALLEIIKDVLLNNEDVISFYDWEGNQIILVNRNSIHDLQKISSYIQNMAETFQLSVHSTLDQTVSLFWSEIVELDGVHEAYHKILEHSRKTLLYSSGVIMGPGRKTPSEKNEKVSKLNAYPTFSMLIESIQKEEAVGRIVEIFEEVETKLNAENLLNIYFIISGALVEDSIKKKVKLEEWAKETQNFFYNFERIGSVHELKSWCMDMTRQYLECTSKKEKNSTNYLIQQVKKMIEEHLEDDISLDEIASLHFIHPNHLSRMFKDREGMTITDYRIKCRIEKAKELLKMPGMKVYEVAEKVGFGSVSSLNRVFKQGTGLTPKEYQGNPV